MWNNPGGGFDQLGGHGGDQGGGYLNSPAPGSSQAGPPQKGRSKLKNILPVTTAQVMRASQVDDGFMLGDTEAHQVTVVGIVRTVKGSATRIDYEIDDMTGPPIEVRQFVDNDENSPDNMQTSNIMENTYVRVYGNIRSFQNKFYITAFRVVKVTDANEITSHLLEVVQVHLKNSKQTSSGGQPAVGYGQSNMSVNAGGGGGNWSGQPDQGLTPIQTQVDQLIRSCQSDCGMNVKEICEKARGIPQKAIRDAIEFLSGEGHIYTTIDDDHYKSTDPL